MSSQRPCFLLLVFQQNLLSVCMSDSLRKRPKTKCRGYVIVYTLLSLWRNSGRLTRVRLQQPQEQRYPVLQVHAGSFCVSAIHRTLTRTTGSLTCVRNHSYACVYTQVVGHTENGSNTFLTQKNSHNLFLLSWRGSKLWISNPTLYQLSHYVTPVAI